MSINPVLTMPRSAEPLSAEFNPRLKAKEGDSCWTTALKVAGVIGAIIASIGSFVFMGPIGGIITTLILGTTGLLIFNSCCGSSAHDHAHDAPATPWPQRLFSWIPTGNYAQPVRNEPHVRVGGGHIQPPEQPRAWYQNWFPFIPDGPRYMDNGNRVRPGGGHGQGVGPHVPVGQGHTPDGGRGPAPGPGHVPPGRGHGNPNPPPGPGPGRGPTQVPPPSGPAGHVPVGRGRRN